MKVRAPGKVVLSGAYAVLHGAPAIVSAVARYVTVDTSRPAELVTPEVRAALEPGEQAPWFDASELRQDGRKLGLGSSAAILVASLYALDCEANPGHSEIHRKARISARARQAHHLAQGGGSGVDIAASTLGGTLLYQLRPTGIHSRSLHLPPAAQVEIWTCPVSASTRDLLSAVAELARRAPSLHHETMAEQTQASEQAVDAVFADRAEAFIAALRAQQRALTTLGSAAGVPIVTKELAALGPVAEAEGGVLLPAGAGGGDIALFVGQAPSSAGLRGALENHAHRRLQTELSAEGVGVA
jgi:phosphomevalonate kinase